MFYGIATFRSDLVRFVRLIRTYLHRTIPPFGRLPTLTRRAEGAYLSFHSLFASFSSNATGQHTENGTCGERRHEQSHKIFRALKAA
jgi:hypothetical protein